MFESPKKNFFGKSFDQFDSSLPPSKKVRFLEDEEIHEFEKNQPVSQSTSKVVGNESVDRPDSAVLMKSKIYKKKSKPIKKNISKIKSNLKRKLSEKSFQELKDADFVENLDFLRYFLKRNKIVLPYLNYLFVLPKFNFETTVII